jgi:hypothetical protein
LTPILARVWGLFVFRSVRLYGLGFLEANCLGILTFDANSTNERRPPFDENVFAWAEEIG